MSEIFWDNNLSSTKPDKDLMRGGRVDDSTNDDEEVFKTDAATSDEEDLDDDDFDDELDDENDLEDKNEQTPGTETVGIP